MPSVKSQILTDVADALDYFWNASLTATHAYSDPTANAVMDGIVSGVAAVANELRAQAKEVVEVVEESCTYGCGYQGPCPGRTNCVHWVNFQYVGPLNHKPIAP